MNDVTLLVAYVRPARRAAVAQALRQVGMAGWTESEVLGHGSAVGGHGVPHARFEVIVATEHIDACENAVVAAAQTGADGDGFVITLPVLSVVRISDRSGGAGSLRGA